jgi:HD-GYP domain-containing protein (c-di-GMP phosphodiesterase class II)
MFAKAEWRWCMGRMQSHSGVGSPGTIHALPPRPVVAATAPLVAASVAALLRTLRSHDGHTASHSESVVELAREVAASLNLSASLCHDVEHAALLHDVGKVGIPPALLEKPGVLNDLELAKLRQHTEIGARLVRAMPGLAHLAPLVRASHERWDGRGYPDRLVGAEIPLASRIVFVCDAYDAMTSERSYSTALRPRLALREVAANAGTQFCPLSARALIATVRRDLNPRGYAPPRWRWPGREGGRRASRC